MKTNEALISACAAAQRKHRRQMVALDAKTFKVIVHTGSLQKFIDAIFKKELKGIALVWPGNSTFTLVA